jgi:ATP-dependent DNA helicase DinG
MSKDLQEIALPTEAQSYIDKVYETLSLQPNFSFRPGQYRLSKAVCASFIDRTPLAAEAPTGTGKTLAYLIGAMAAKTAPQLATTPIVVATATKALQAQMIHSDLPKLVAAGGIRPNDYVLSKGKGNYLCIRDAKDVASLGQDMFGEASEEEEIDETSVVNPEHVDLMLKAYTDGSWDGDFDSYLGEQPRYVDRIRVKSETCTMRKCDHYAKCSYFTARAKMTTAQVIVSNHDQVLADLKMNIEDDTGYFPATNYLLVVDEAHKFPDKALQIGQTELNVVDFVDKVYRLRSYLTILDRHDVLASVLKPSPVIRDSLEAKALIAASQVLISELAHLDVHPDSNQLRFPKGVLPPRVKDAVTAVLDEIRKVSIMLTSTLTTLRDFPVQAEVSIRKSITEAKHIGLKASQALRNADKALFEFTSPGRAVRWTSKHESRITVNTSPLESAAVLNPLLWNAPRAQPVFVSATLRDLAGFGRFQRSCGLPPTSKYETMPYIFPYSESEVVVTGMSATPKAAERTAYLKELRSKLPKAIRSDEATLILVPSRVMLREITPMLKSRIGEDAVLVQGEGSIQALLDRHGRRVAQGLPSVLVGMATMAEGLDLPGKLCVHVIVLALPFSVPTDPVEQELAEVLGSRYFGERSLPDAMTRLLQMVGRLLRRETDRGRITIFDRRIASTSYGRKMLAALPPFKQVIEPLTA